MPALSRNEEVRMRSGIILCVAMFCVPAAHAQQDTLNVDDLLQSAEQWAKKNLDEKTVEAIKSGDPEKLKKALAELETQMRGKYVIDLAALRDTARSLVPLLDSYEETAPYANWLRTRLDYFDVADDARKTP